MCGTLQYSIKIISGDNTDVYYDDSKLNTADKHLQIFTHKNVEATFDLNYVVGYQTLSILRMLGQLTLNFLSCEAKGPPVVLSPNLLGVDGRPHLK